MTIGLNKGEAHHTLKRAIRFYRRAAIPDRTQLEQDLHAMTLNLVVTATTLLEHCLSGPSSQIVQEHGIPLPPQYRPHISPLGWEHIALTGTYQWKGAESTWGRFRPLRLSALDQLAAYTAWRCFLPIGPVWPNRTRPQFNVTGVLTPPNPRLPDALYEFEGR